MRIAYCFYGQPRKIREGNKNISEFLKKQDPKITIDFFYHTWYLSDDKNLFDCSPWSHYNETDIKMPVNYKYLLEYYYKPKSCMYESVKKFEITDDIVNSVFYQNSSDAIKKNIPNILSQCYSRQKVRDMILMYKYDYIITSRFDFLNEININLSELKKNTLYVSNMHLPRKIFPDNFMICCYDMFIDIFNINNNLHQIINIPTNLYNEIPHFNIEELLFYNYFYTGYDIENVIYTEKIPNFMSK